MGNASDAQQHYNIEEPFKESPVGMLENNAALENLKLKLKNEGCRRIFGFCSIVKVAEPALGYP